MMHFSRLAATAFAVGSLMIGAASAQTVLRAADTHPDGYPTVEAVKYFGELLKERTNGRYSVEMFHSSQLGQEADTVEQVRASSVDIQQRVRRGDELLTDASVTAAFLDRDGRPRRQPKDWVNKFNAIVIQGQ